MSKPNFSNLAALTVRADREIDFVFALIEGEPRLKVRPATEANRPYFNAVLRSSGKGLLKRMRGGRLNAEALAESRAQDRKLFAEFVVRGWENVVDGDGVAVPFSRENVEGFLEALPADLFDELRAFCSNPDNFRGENALTQEDTEKLKGN